MVVILFMVGLAEFDTLARSLLPVAVYLGINVIEAQFVTPMVIGRTMTLNPFVVVLALIFWIWLWGPLGGFIAIPALLVVYAVIRNIVPGINWGVDDIDRGTLTGIDQNGRFSKLPDRPLRPSDDGAVAR